MRFGRLTGCVCEGAGEGRGLCMNEQAGRTDSRHINQFINPTVTPSVEIHTPRGCESPLKESPSYNAVLSQQSYLQCIVTNNVTSTAMVTLINKLVNATLPKRLFSSRINDMMRKITRVNLQ